MDGVLWHGETAVPGLASFFDTLRQLGIGFVLATNNATRTVAQYQEKLARFGVTIPAEQILTSAEAAAGYLAGHYPADTPVYVVGEAGLHQAITNRGFPLLNPQLTIDNWQLTIDHSPPIVVAGLNRHACYDELATAAILIRAGAAFIGTNPDLTLPSERGQMPGAGSILAFLSAATGVQPFIVGKPGPVLYQEALKRLGGSPADTVALGDRLETDIAGGYAAGIRTILVLSGVSTQADVAAGSLQPDWIFDDITGLAAYLLGNED
jgi:4-nitrophenyl phosphatase